MEWKDGEMPPSANEIQGRVSRKALSLIKSRLKDEDDPLTKALMDAVADDIRNGGPAAKAVAENIRGFGCIREAVDDAIDAAFEGRDL